MSLSSISRCRLLTESKPPASCTDCGLCAKLVFLTMHREVTYAARALEAGASGFVLKHSAASELVTAIHEALKGGTYITPQIASELLDSYRRRESPQGRRRPAYSHRASGKSSNLSPTAARPRKSHPSSASRVAPPSSTRPA